MKTKLTLAAACAALTVAANAVNAATILYVANSNSAAFQTFAETAGHTWTFKASGTGTTAETIGQDLDQSITIGGATQTRKSYMQSFDLIIVSTPISSNNYADGANGADWAAITKPILFTASFAARATVATSGLLGNRVGLLSGTDLSPYTFSSADETTKVSSSALANALFSGTTSQTNILGAASGQAVTGATLGNILVGGGEVITTNTNGTSVGAGIVYWNSGALDSLGKTLANNRSLFSLNGSFADLNADGQIVMANLINQTISPIPEPSTFAALAGFGALGFAAYRRRRA